MILHNMGMEYRHSADFKIIRPCGSGDNLFLLFKSPAIVVINGNETAVEKGYSILYSKNTPQIYGADGSEFVNHWVHFDCDENDVFFKKTGTRFDMPFSVPSVGAVENILELLSIESVSGGSCRDECTDLLLHLLIAKASEADRNGENNTHREKLRELRAQIYGNPAGKFTIGAMAESLSLSPAYFQTLYKSEFGVSCYEDVLCAKIRLAEYYLSNTKLSVHGIAELCGYENDVHFMRQFRKRVGMTALEYRAGKVVQTDAKNEVLQAKL